MKTPQQMNSDIQVLVFETNIQDERDVEKAGFMLNNYHAIKRWTVDLDDWEKVLRVEANAHCSTHEVERLISNLGYKCYELMH